VSEESFKKLEELSSKYPEVVFLAITGSIARKGFSMHDVDVAVKLSAVRDRYEVLTSVLTDISEILKVPEECVDLIDLDRADPEVKAGILRNSVVIIDRGYYEELVKEVENLLKEYGELRELSIKEWLYSQDPTSVDISIIKRRFDFVRSEVEFLKEQILGKPVDEVKNSQF